MKQRRFHLFFSKLLRDAEGVMTAKAKDYANEDNAFANFDARAEQLGLTREQVWAVFANKHWDALMAYVRNGQVESEPLRQRCIDVINYVGFLAGFDAERREEQLERLEDLLTRPYTEPAPLPGGLIPQPFGGWKVTCAGPEAGVGYASQAHSRYGDVFALTTQEASR